MSSKINRHFNKLTPIGYRYDSNDSNEGFAGTGFFYYSQYSQPVLMNEDELPPFGPYLVTNKHIVKPTEATDPDHLSIYLRDGEQNRSPVRYDMSLYDNQDDPVWLEHPEKDVDVVLILLDHSLGPRFTYTRSEIPQTGKEVSGGDLARVIGYPTALPEFRRFPIMRNSLISSPYRISFEDAEFFYFDARLHHGMSGSPVVYVPPEYLPIDEINVYRNNDSTFQEPIEGLDIGIESYNMPNTNNYLLGIHSDERIKTENESIVEIQDRLDQLSDDGENSLVSHLESILEELEGETGLNVAWHAHLIEEIREESGVTEEDAVELVAPSER